MTRRWSALRVAVALLGTALVTIAGVQVAVPATAAPVAAGPVPAAFDDLHVPIVGSGSSWSGNMIAQWVSNVRGNYNWTVNYSSQGSTVGRNEFANGVTQFGGTDIPYAIADSNEIESLPNRAFAYMPIVAGGTALMYNLVIAGNRVTNLRLSGDSIAKIFTGEITQWNDPQIAAENPALSLPAIPVIPVVRSDGAGETAQFSLWMRQEHTAVWDAYCGKVGRPYVNGHCGVTSNYPTVPGSRFIAQSGANGVASYTASKEAVGAITIVQYSYALNLKFPVAKMLNAAGYYTEPTAQNVAVALLQAQINYDESSINYLTQDLSGVYVASDPRVYPLSSYSYVILPVAPTDGSQPVGLTKDQAVTLADFSAYFLCEGQQIADISGYSPLPINLVSAGQRQIQKIPGGNPIIKGTTDCNNPTFDPTDTSPQSNKLARTAPYPPECDKAGPQQCLTGTGGAQDVATAASGGNATNPGADAANAADASAVDAATSAGSAAAAGGSVVVDAAPVVLSALPQTLPPATIGVLAPLTLAAAGAGLILAAVLPPVLGRRRRATVLVTPTRGSPRSPRGGTR
ncbi:substrate-binding domain-containing protein [Microbacterium sp.]|uniref:substrate-binding domain-containing protein n=1 Tax=Microbacterium sp. TaxID=51671 RepID=UPI00262EE476|nr:substrate-binding domain-containing protein [Microbacterium sp.]